MRGSSGQAVTEYALIMMAMTLIMTGAFAAKFEALKDLCGTGQSCSLGLALINAVNAYAGSYDFVLSLPFP